MTERIARGWCWMFHRKSKNLSWPVNGRYRCLVCLREYPSWKEGKERKPPESPSARRYKIGWVWWDKWGKDYGPWPTTKRMAEVLGQEHANREERLLGRGN